MDRPRIPEEVRGEAPEARPGRGHFLRSPASPLGSRTSSPARPSVAREQLYLDEVKEGTLERKVRGPGALQPREARWLSTRGGGARRSRAGARRRDCRAGRGHRPALESRSRARGRRRRARSRRRPRRYAAARLDSKASAWTGAPPSPRRARPPSPRASRPSRRSVPTPARSPGSDRRSKILAAAARRARRDRGAAPRLALDSAVSAQLEARRARLRQQERSPRSAASRAIHCR